MLKEICYIFFGGMPFSALYVRSSILYVIRCLTGRQCSLRRTGVICSELRVLVTNRVSQLCTYCSLSITDRCKPYKRALKKSNLDEINA